MIKRKAAAQAAVRLLLLLFAILSATAVCANPDVTVLIPVVSEQGTVRITSADAVRTDAGFQLTFHDPGNYAYTVTNTLFREDTYRVSVYVVNGQNGNLEAAVVIRKNQSGEKLSRIRFASREQQETDQGHSERNPATGRRSGSGNGRTSRMSRRVNTGDATPIGRYLLAMLGAILLGLISLRKGRRIWNA